MENVAPGQQLAESRLPSLDCTRPSLEAFNALPPRTSSAAAQQQQRQAQRSQQEQQEQQQSPQASGGAQAAVPQGLLGLCGMLGVQSNMRQALGRLAAVARDLPVPMRMLVSDTSPKSIAVPAFARNA
jgi:hypothetical protein